MSRKLKTLCALICTALLMLTMCFSASGVFLEGADIKAVNGDRAEAIPLYLNGKPIGQALKIGSTSYVCAHEFCEALLGRSCNLGWDSSSGTLCIRSEDFLLSINLADGYMSLNDRYIATGGAFNIEGCIYIPVRPMAKAFAADLSWLSRGEDALISLNHTPGRLITPGSEFYNQEDLYWLSRVIYAESGNQPLAGRIGVGNVVLNRRNDESGFFPDSVREVIFQPGQFSVVDAGTIYHEPPQHCIEAAKLCLEGFNTVGDCLFFLNPAISNSAWFDTNRVFRLSIGEHYFYA